MAEKTEKTTASSKLDGFLTKNKKGVIITFAVILILVVGFVAFEILKSTSSKKDLAKIETFYYELMADATDIDDTAIAKRSTECLEKLEPYTKKNGIAGVRANMLSAELAYIQADYEAAIAYYDAAYTKDKKAYTAPLCLYTKGSSYEDMNKLSEAADAYRAAAEFKDFGMASHAYFSLGRVLEAQKDYAGAAEVYKTMNDKFADDDWANLAKTRLVELKAKGMIN